MDGHLLIIIPRTRSSHICVPLPAARITHHVLDDVRLCHCPTTITLYLLAITFVPGIKPGFTSGTAVIAFLRDSCGLSFVCPAYPWQLPVIHPCRNQSVRLLHCERKYFTAASCSQPHLIASSASHETFLCRIEALTRTVIACISSPRCLGRPALLLIHQFCPL